MGSLGGLDETAAVAQLLGVDAAGLISMILNSAVTARKNKKECAQLACRVSMIDVLLRQLPDSETMLRPLDGLVDTLREAHELVASCQKGSLPYRLVTALWHANNFRDVQRRIDNYLMVFPVISHIHLSGLLDRLRSENHTSVPSPCSNSQLECFTTAEFVAASNGFADGNLFREHDFGTVYKGRLHDGREVAIKRISCKAPEDAEKVFRAELAVLPRLRHKHIVRLLGCCAEKEERLFVYELTHNSATLYDSLHGRASPPATWEMRVKVLLGVSQAIEYLHCYAEPPVIHRSIKSASIILDAGWTPRVVGFGECSVVGTPGYLDGTDYCKTGRLKAASDVYNLGVVMLEALTGKPPVLTNYEEEKPMNLVSFALPFIEAGEVAELLDRRLAPELTPRQLEALELVAQTAAHCLRVEVEDRPPITDVVAKLHVALKLMGS